MKEPIIQSRDYSGKWKQFWDGSNEFENKSLIENN